MGLFEKIKNLINSEIRDENEPKEIAVLVRILSLIDVLFVLMSMVFLFVTGNEIYGAYAIVILAALFVVLFLSYKLNMHSLIGLYYVTMLVFGGYFAMCFGVTPMYQIQLLIVFLLYFYRSNETTFSRIAAVCVSGILVLSTVFLVSANGAIIPQAKQGETILIFINTVHILVKVAVIGAYFRVKFSASETKILQYSKKLEMIATTDPLTKLQNRRGMYTHIEDYIKEHVNDNNFVLTLGIGDIDFFKKINDTYGHEAGDYVLETLAKLMKEFMKDKGMVARWGGEEFLFCFEEENGDYAFESLSKLLHLIERYEFSYNNIDFKVTMTFGLEEFDEREGIEKTISKADQKLYMGKEAGRNRVIY